jgi:hypothetical protein
MHPLELAIPPHMRFLVAEEVIKKIKAIKIGVVLLG